MYDKIMNTYVALLKIKIDIREKNFVLSLLISIIFEEKMKNYLI